MHHTYNAGHQALTLLRAEKEIIAVFVLYQRLEMQTKGNNSIETSTTIMFHCC